MRDDKGINLCQIASARWDRPRSCVKELSHNQYVMSTPMRSIAYRGQYRRAYQGFADLTIALRRAAPQVIQARI
jgi:hypothetical protein